MGNFYKANGGTAKVETGKFEGNPSGIFINSCYKIYYRPNLLAGSITKILFIKSFAVKLQDMLAGNTYLLFLIFSYVI